MKKLIFLLSFLSLAACQDGGFSNSQSVTPPHEKSTAGNSIIGGQDAQAGSDISKLVFSFKSLVKPLENQVGAQDIPVINCTASALTRRLVLTAAHCINGDNPSYVEFTQGKITTTIPVIKTVIIDDYKTDKYADLALAVLKDSLPEDTLTVSIPNPDMKIDLQKLDLISAGFGKDVDSTTVQDETVPTKAGEDGLGVLRVVLLKISGYEFEDSKFLVDQTNGKGFCQGDSGGPGMFEYDQKYYIMGVATKTEFPEQQQSKETTGVCSFRGAYVNLLKFKKWIEGTAKDLTDEIQLLEAATANKDPLTDLNH